MKTRCTKQWMKATGISLMLSMAALAANAQHSTADITKQTAAALGTVGTGLTDGGSIRVIDNKGTIKYLQVQNGITQVTSTAPNGGVITTWQLGGKFNDNTTFDFNGKTLSFNSMVWNSNADGTATTANPGANLPATSQTATTGYTILVRDEATGNIMKMLLKDLIKGGNKQAAATAGADYTYTDPTVPTDVNKIFVFRNGAKLLAGVDYTIAGAAGLSTVTVKHASGTDPEDYTFITGDKIEIQWIQ
jgi:hypothetical protein